MASFEQQNEARLLEMMVGGEGLRDLARTHRQRRRSWAPMGVNVVVNVRCQIGWQVAGHAVKVPQCLLERWRLGFHRLDPHHRARGPVNIGRQHDLSTFDCGCDAQAILFAWNLIESKTHSGRNREPISVALLGRGA